ncbi:MAG: UDP-2,4-diacetamido-2,4,6-trideoxy-beta-L-altropyranose hydrolase [Ignavibacteria bacterium]|nr:UDP-2,4-diacetamido-2,4,6-trideoxy-beta-L-altropyranose hydrolase [Ignavibacteria bacterium]
MPESCVLFRVDAGPQIGLGHLQRCLSLASALRQLDATCLFLTNEESNLLDRVTRFGFSGYRLDAIESWSAEDLAQTISIAGAHGCDAIIVDSDYEGDGYLDQLRKAGFFVCAIEDMAPHPFPCQLVVNGDAHAHQLAYHSSSGDTLFLLGPEYSILRAEFWKIGPRVVSDGVENILVTFGGADQCNLTPRALGLLNQLPGNLSVTTIIGPFFNNIEEIEDSVARAERPVRLVYSPDEVGDLMLQADLAISAGGQTLYELACAGCPTVAVRMAANQDGQLGVFEESGFIRIAGHGDDDGVVQAIGDAIRTLLPDADARATMSAAGQRLIDGQGALRVARAILGAINTHKRSSQAVKLSIADQIDGDTRRFH